MTLLEQLAWLLHDRTLGTYAPDSTGGDVFLEDLPLWPEVSLGLWIYAGPEASALHGYDEPRWQVRVRGPRDPRVGLARAQQVYDTLHGLPHTTLRGGTRLITCLGRQSGPIFMARDENHRSHHSLNFRLEVRNNTPHRI